MKKVLVFGCAGFVGKYLIDEFIKNAYDVIGADIVSTELWMKKDVATYYEVDILNYQEVYSLMDEIQPDYVVNLAAVSSVAQSWVIPQRTMEVNVVGAINILESVKKCCIKSKVLLVGSSEEYAISDEPIRENYLINANNPYGISKVTMENFSEIYRDEYGMNIINTRTFNHTGVGQLEKFVIPSFVRQVAEIHRSKKGGKVLVGNLDAMRDIGDVRDMVSAYRMILESDTIEKVFNVGSGECYSLKSILNYIVSLTNEKVDVIVDQSKLRPLDNPIIWCDNSRIKKEIGWEPQYSVYDAIEKMFKEMTTG